MSGDHEKNMRVSLGELTTRVETKMNELTTQKIMPRILKHDHTVWKPEPTEITNRLGWLYCPENTSESLADIRAFVNEVRGEGFTHVLLLGMGGSSLAPEVFRKIFAVKDGYLDLSILDSTDPGAVLERAQQHDPEKTLYIVSTKSGATVETLSFMKYFYNQVLTKVGPQKVGNHFVAITDPGSGLEQIAKKLKFRKLFLNDPNIGGRFSALSLFGIVPAALLGVDIEKILKRGEKMRDTFAASNPDADNAFRLGVIMGELATAGKDKLTLVFSPSFAPFGAWVEQLIAESTGKEGTGILPIDNEELTTADNYASDRLFVYLKLSGESEHDAQITKLKKAGFPVVELVLIDLYDLGGEFFRWEMATAVASHILKINPFDQPNVESAKARARNMVAAFQVAGKLPELTPVLTENQTIVYGDLKAENLGQALRLFLAKMNPGDKQGRGRSYLSIQAYVQPSAAVDAAMHKLRTKIQTELHIGTTTGYGPRFLHSTGQLHKGDAGHGLFIQITATMPQDAEIPDEAGSESSSISFGVLKTAQCLGDREALLENKRNVIRFHLESDVAAGINDLTVRI